MPFPGSGLGAEGGANGIGAGIGVLGADVYLFGSAVAALVVINTVFYITTNAAVELFILHVSFLLSVFSMPSAGGLNTANCKKGSIP